jgi:hypothetical protein
MKVLLGIIDNKRPDYLSKTISSLEDNIDFDFTAKVLIDDSGDEIYSQYLLDVYGDKYSIISHPENKGLSGSIRTLWSLAKDLNVDYVFHLEGDFTFNEKIDIYNLHKIFGVEQHLAQIALKRQPVNLEEAKFNGFMNMDPSAYQDKFIPEINYYWVEHRKFFTLNPSLYPKWVIELGWENGWGEKEFTDRLLADSLVKCGFYGEKSDNPRVHHIGDFRAGNWFV